MTIYRWIGGVKVGFVLTPSEMAAAFYEMQHDFDVEDVLMTIEEEKWLFEEGGFGCTKEDVMKEVDEISRIYRDRMDTCIEYRSVAIGAIEEAVKKVNDSK